MHPRTLYALLATALLLGTGSALAQMTPQETAEPQPATPTTPTTDQPAEAFHLKVRPAPLYLRAGDSARVHVLLEGAPSQTYTIELRVPDGLAPIVDMSRAETNARGYAEATLALTARGSDARDVARYTATVLATDADGALVERRFEVYVKPTGPARPEPAHPEPVRPEPGHPEPARPQPIDGEPAKPMPIYGEPAKPRSFVVVDPVWEEDRPAKLSLARLFGMIKDLDARVTRIEQRAHDDGPRIVPNPPLPASRLTLPAGAFRMTLSDADVEVPREGARIAVLLQGGGVGGEVPLSVRSDTVDGWTYRLEMDSLRLDANGRAWAWLEIVPGETSRSTFTVHAGEPSTGQMAQGTASIATPHIA